MGGLEGPAFDLAVADISEETASLVGMEGRLFETGKLESSQSFLGCVVSLLAEESESLVDASSCKEEPSDSEGDSTDSESCVELFVVEAAASELSEAFCSESFAGLDS